MNCIEVKSKLDDYFDCLLPALEKHTIVAHLHACESCSADAECHQQYLKKMQEFNSPPLTAGGSVHLLKKARATALKGKNGRIMRVRQASFWQGVFVATVMTCLLFFGKSWLDLASDSSRISSHLSSRPIDVTNEISSQMSEVIVWSDVKILINVPQDLHNARIVLTLPRGVHVEGYEGLSQVSWQVDFLKGANSLVMPVWLDSSIDLTVDQTLSATLEYEGQSKSFDLEIVLNDALVKNHGASLKANSRIDRNV